MKIVITCQFEAKYFAFLHLCHSSISFFNVNGSNRFTVEELVIIELLFWLSFKPANWKLRGKCAAGLPL